MKDVGKGPSAIGLGVMKSGTTWVYKQLKAHPQIGIPRLRGRRIKEMHFFDRLQITLSEYCLKFDKLKTFKTFDCTPNYFPLNYAPPFIKTHFPNAKLFVIFRNPADRAFSHYKDHLYYGKIPPEVSFIQAFHEDYPKKELSCFSIKNKGMYADHLERWFKEFDKDQLKIMFYEDLIDNPLKFIQEIYKHIGIENYIPPKYQEKVLKRYNKAFDDMKFEAKDKLGVSNFYRDQVQKLSDLTGRKLDNWVNFI